jgi:hypothetical protein
MAAKLGMDAKAYLLTSGTRASWGTADSDGFNSGAAPANLSALSNLQDVSIPVTKGEADITTRGNNGWRAILGTLKDVSVDLNMVYDTADTLQIALLKAWIGNTSVAVALLDGDKATVGSRGLWADWQVVGCNKEEALEDGQKIVFTIKPTLTSVAPQYVKVTAGT